MLLCIFLHKFLFFSVFILCIVFSLCFFCDSFYMFYLFVCFYISSLFFFLCIFLWFCVAILSVFDCFALLLTDVLNLVVFVCVGVCSCLSVIAWIRRNINNQTKTKKKKTTHHTRGYWIMPLRIYLPWTIAFNHSKLFPHFVWFLL